jgi:hypothetical protein
MASARRNAAVPGSGCFQGNGGPRGLTQQEVRTSAKTLTTASRLIRHSLPLGAIGRRPGLRAIPHLAHPLCPSPHGVRQLRVSNPEAACGEGKREQ